MTDRATAGSAASTWDRLAPRYAAQERLETRAITAALRVAAIQPDERLVDLATGTGLLLRELARSPHAPGEAVGVDLSQGMLARAGALAPGWRTLLADARDVPLPDGWADVVTCSYLLQLLHPGARAAVLGEARRLLAPGGRSRLVLVTVWADERRPGGRLANAGLGLLARARPDAWGGLAPLDPQAELASAGLRVTRRVVLPRGGYPSLVLVAAPAPFRSS